MNKTLHRSLAIVALAALSACNGGGGTSSGLPPTPGGGTGSQLLARIVGVGDSLTAGTQSGTTMGLPGKNPFPPPAQTPPTQENGWWGLFDLAAYGIAPDPAHFNLTTPLADPGGSPLPLINAPGIGSQILISLKAGFYETHLDCDSFSRAAYNRSTALSTVRVNPNNTVYDVAVPGITMHEALYMRQPMTGPPPPPVNGTCPGYHTIPGDPTSGALQTLVQSSSENFYPVLGGFKNVYPLTEVNAAVSLHPTLTTVWLGANDMLEYIFSGGRSPSSDSPQQMHDDLTRIVQRLQRSGSKVIVADLPLVLETPQFFQGGVQPPGSQSVFFYLQLLSAFSAHPISPAQATAIVNALQAQCGVGPQGYLTESAFLALFQALQAGTYNPAAPTCMFDTHGAGSGLGTYLTDAFAAKVDQLNVAYNQAIDATAKETGSPLVPVSSLFHSIYVNKGLSIPGGGHVNLNFGGGMVGFDGLHPSITGYAVIANAFIQAADKSFGAKITPLQLEPFYQADVYRLFPS